MSDTTLPPGMDSLAHGGFMSVTAPLNIYPCEQAQSPIFSTVSQNDKVAIDLRCVQAYVKSADGGAMIWLRGGNIVLKEIAVAEFIVAYDKFHGVK